MGTAVYHCLTDNRTAEETLAMDEKAFGLQ